MVIRALRERARRFRRKVRKDLLLRGTGEEVFARIYRRNRWRSRESRSGRGSEMTYTENLRRELPRLLKEYEVFRMLDAPCGDFNWMQNVVPGLGIEYIGGDIVKALVLRNEREFGAAGISFHPMDITSDPLPNSDLMIVRDCLFHLSYDDVFRFLDNFCRSDIGLLLTTTHLPLEGVNRDIKTGDYRKIYLFSPPFCFPREPLRRIEDWVPPHSPREMCLFAKEQVIAARHAMKRSLEL